MLRRSALLIVLGFVTGAALRVQAEDPPPPIRILVPPADVDRAQVTVAHRLLLDADQLNQPVQVSGHGMRLTGQLTSQGLLNATKEDLAVDREKVVAELHFVVPRIEANTTLEFGAVWGQSPSEELSQFAWKDESGKQADLVYGDRPVLRYMYKPVDNSSPERRDETYKVYHHLFDPTGEKLLTKGPGGLFPHHRGLFFGYNRISYGDGQTADIWHCRNGESQVHQSIVRSETGPVLGRHELLIHWNGKDGQPFAQEEREITVYHVDGGQLIDFASHLSTTVGDVQLDGDPQHAGVQFRATQHVPDVTKAETYYLRPDGKGEPGKFRNWPDNKEHVDLPWNALSFVVDGTRYTCCYLDHPQNPKEARYSERDYGRFGSYFEYTLTGDQPLRVRYRLWLQEGEMTVDEVSQLHAGFRSTRKVRP